MFLNVYHMKCWKPTDHCLQVWSMEQNISMHGRGCVRQWWCSASQRVSYQCWASWLSCFIVTCMSVIISANCSIDVAEWQSVSAYGVYWHLILYCGWRPPFHGHNIWGPEGLLCFLFTRTTHGGHLYQIYFALWRSPYPCCRKKIKI